MTSRNKFTLWGIVVVSILGTISHFVYQWSGNSPLAAAFFPTNESTWEHMKLLFFPMLLYVLISAPSLKTEYPRILSASFAGILLGVFLIPVLFYTYSGILGYNLAPVDIAIFFISVIAAFLFTDFLIRSDSDWVVNAAPILAAAVIILFAAFVFFSYCPPELGIFADPTGN